MIEAGVVYGSDVKKYLYVEIYEKLFRLIETRNFKEGDQLPGENQLALEFGVSRMTLRQALMLMTEDGIIRRVHGKGNFIANLNHRSSVGLEGVANPIATYATTPIQEVNINIRFEAASDYVQQLFGYGKSMVMMASDRWYLSDKNLIAFCFSFSDLAATTACGVDLQDPEAVKRYMERTVYEICPHATTHLTVSTRKEFSLTAAQISAPLLILLTETLFSPEGKTIVQNKYYMNPSNFDLVVHGRRSATY